MNRAAKPGPGADPHPIPLTSTAKAVFRAVERPQTAAGLSICPEDRQTPFPAPEIAKAGRFGRDRQELTIRNLWKERHSAGI